MRKRRIMDSTADERDREGEGRRVNAEGDMLVGG